jgi:hypothetical protein
MNQPSRWGFARLARVAAFGLAFLVGAGRLTAQGTTGKIEGTVRDQAGAPIAGAQVLIVGSAFATTSNEQGYYFINNVPAGVMAVRAQYIGYAPAEVRNVRVFAGQTMTVNLNLEQRAIEVGGITVTVEQNPIVPRDQVTSKPIVSGDLVNDLPVDAIGAVLALQPGVVAGRGGALSIRGGRPGEAITYIDGVPVRSVTGNTATVTVGTNAIEEASVTTGAIGATQGDAQSGVISLVTRAGGSRYSGFLGYQTDEVAGETYGSGLHRVEASFGGPLYRNLTFFVATTMQGQQSALRGKGADEQPVYVANGIDTTILVANTPGSATSDSTIVNLPAFTRYSDGMRRPDNWNNTWTIDAKVQYTYGTGSRLSATYHRTRTQGLNWRGGNIFNPMAQSGFRNNSTALILNWAQNLARSSERALFLEAALSYQHDLGIGGAVDQAWFNDNRSPFGGFTFGDMQFLWDDESFPVDDRLIQNLRVGNCRSGRDAARPTLGGCIPAIDRNDIATSARFRTNPYGVTPGSFPETGIGNPGLNLNEESRIVGRVNLDWQADRYNRFQFGGDFQSADATIFGSNLANLIFFDANKYSPSRMGLYATDRLDLGDVVVDLGLRFDRFNPGVLYPRTPGRIFTDPLRTGDLSRAFTAEDTLIANQCAAYLAANDTTRWSTCNMFEGSSKSVLLPSVRVSFPVTDRTGFRLAYAQQAQTPNFNLIATGVNTDLAFTNTNDLFGRELDYGKTILFEFGVRHAFTSDLVLDISAYNKDKVSDVTGRVMPVLDPVGPEIMNVNLMTNQDFGNVRGIDFKLDSRVGSLFQGSISYTLQSSKSTGSDPTEYLNTLSRIVSNVTNDRAPPPQAILTTADNRTHTIAGSAALNFPHGWRQGTLLGSILQDVGAFATFRFASGLPYTLMLNTGSGATGPGNLFGLAATPLEPLNNSRMPWIKNVDLRLTKGIQVGGARELTVFADFRNLFNWTNLVAIFAETGDVVNALHRDNTINPQLVTLANEAGSLVTTRTIGGEQVTGINLADCSQYRPTDMAGLPNCLMLRRAEERFAIGESDQFFTEAEQNAAFRAWYNLNNGPHTLRGAGLNFRFGFEFNF